MAERCYLPSPRLKYAGTRPEETNEVTVAQCIDARTHGGKARRDAQEAENSARLDPQGSQPPHRISGLHPVQDRERPGLADLRQTDAHQRRSRGGLLQLIR